MQQVERLLIFSAIHSISTQTSLPTRCKTVVLNEKQAKLEKLEAAKADRDLF